MQAHACDLRAEVEKDWTTLSDAPRPDDVGLDAFVSQMVADWRGGPLTPAVRRMLEHADKSTRATHACDEKDIFELRAAGWSDEAIHDAMQVIAYFNYINRMADSLGVDPEPNQRRW